MKNRIARNPGLWLALVVLALWITGSIMGQQQQSGGPGSSVTIAAALPAGTNLIGKTGIDQTTPGTTNGVSVAQLGSTSVATGTGAANGGTLRVAVSTDSSFSIANSAFGLNAGTAIVGYVRAMPSGCSTLTSDVVHDVVGVATGAGTSVSSVTGCIEALYINNITNSAVTFRLADKTGTPIIWVGGNADFSIPANSNMGLPFMAGITMTSGMTAIAGTASALNLHIVTRE